METSNAIVVPTKTPRKRKDTREAYNRVVPKAWGDMPDSQDSKLIRSAIMGVWRHLYGKPCKYKVLVGKGTPWSSAYDYKRREWVIYFMPKKGLRDAIHDVTHWIHRIQFPRDNPHSPRHMEMERAAAEYVAKRFG